MFLVPHRVPNRLQLSFVFGIHLDESQHGKVIAAADAAQMSLQISGERLVSSRGPRQVRRILLVGEELDAAVFHDGFFRGQGTGLFVLRCQIPSRNLAGLDIGLVEGVDADDGACDRGGNLPAEKFRAQIIDVGHRDSQHGVPGLFERRHLRIDLHIRGMFGVDVGEHAIVAVNLRRAQFFAIHRDNAFSNFARGLGQQLLEPRAEVGNIRRSDDRDFIAAAPRRRAQNNSEHRARIFFDAARKVRRLAPFPACGREIS